MPGCLVSPAWLISATRRAQRRVTASPCLMMSSTGEHSTSGRSLGIDRWPGVLAGRGISGESRGVVERHEPRRDGGRTRPPAFPFAYTTGRHAVASSTFEALATVGTCRGHEAAPEHLLTAGLAITVSVLCYIDWTTFSTMPRRSARRCDHEGKSVVEPISPIGFGMAGTQRIHGVSTSCSTRPMRRSA